MTPKSIRSHLAPYSILGKRKTTVAHAFASALAPTDEFEKEKIEAALDALGQKNLKQLSCVYCSRIAQTWDHLVNLVQKGELNGFGHQIGNLVPCCRDCNSDKGSTPFEDFVNSRDYLDDDQKSDLICRLKQHLNLAKPIQETNNPEALTELNKIKLQIFHLMKEADRYAAILRNGRNA